MKYGHSFDAHLIPWAKAEFNVTVEQSIADHSLYAFVGQYMDPDTEYGMSECVRFRSHVATIVVPSVFEALTDYAGGYDAALFDRLTCVEFGEG